MELKIFVISILIISVIIVMRSKFKLLDFAKACSKYENFRIEKYIRKEELKNNLQLFFFCTSLFVVTFLSWGSFPFYVQDLLQIIFIVLAIVFLVESLLHRRRY